MGRKKTGQKNKEFRPFCYYCDRDFDDEKTLIQHQKQRHFKCTECHRKLDTATGLVVHMLQVHKTEISKVPHALPERDNPDLIIHGMENVPLEMVAERKAGTVTTREAANAPTIGTIDVKDILAPTPAETYALSHL